MGTATVSLAALVSQNHVGQMDIEYCRLPTTKYTRRPGESSTARMGALLADGHVRRLTWPKKLQKGVLTTSL